MAGLPADVGAVSCLVDLCRVRNPSRYLERLWNWMRHRPSRAAAAIEFPVSDIRIVRDYPHPIAKVWRAVTDPALVPLWTATGAGGRPEGFAPTVGTRFRLIAKPKPGWNGVVDCEVLR